MVVSRIDADRPKMQTPAELYPKEHHRREDDVPSGEDHHEGQHREGQQNDGIEGLFLRQNLYDAKKINLD
jgi:hypothetical protein